MPQILVKPIYYPHPVDILLITIDILNKMVYINIMKIAFGVIFIVISIILAGFSYWLFVPNFWGISTFETLLVIAAITFVMTCGILIGALLIDSAAKDARERNR